MMGLGAILFSRQNRRCRKSAPNCNIMGANGDKQLRFRAEHPANLFRAGSASCGVSWRFCVSLMTARCCVRASICVPAGANHCRERTPRQIANLMTCLAALWLHHGAGGRPFVPVCGHYDETAALRLPYRGLEGGLLSRYLWIMTTNEDTWPPSGSILGLEGGLFSPLSADYGETHGRPLAPITGAGGRPFVPVSADYDDER